MYESPAEYLEATEDLKTSTRSNRALFGESLCEFLAKRGGLKEYKGELQSMDAHLWHRAKPCRPKLVNPKGMTLDDAALLAWESGYFSETDERPDINDLLIAIGDELAGCPRYQPLSLAAEEELYCRALAAERDMLAATYIEPEEPPPAPPQAAAVAARSIPVGSREESHWSGAVAHLYEIGYVNRKGRPGTSYYAKCFLPGERKAALHKVFPDEATRSAPVARFLESRQFQRSPKMPMTAEDLLLTPHAV